MPYAPGVPVLKAEGLSIRYEVHGSGPAVGIPWCNFAGSPLDLRCLTSDYTVVIASPRGFGGGEGDRSGYRAATIRSDLEAV